VFFACAGFKLIQTVRAVLREQCDGAVAVWAAVGFHGQKKLFGALDNPTAALVRIGQIEVGWGDGKVGFVYSILSE
jgi:hypothetical protein